MKARSSEFTAYLAYLHRIPAPLSSEEPSVDDKGFDICPSVACRPARPSAHSLHHLSLHASLSFARDRRRDRAGMLAVLYTHTPLVVPRLCVPCAIRLSVCPRSLLVALRIVASARGSSLSISIGLLSQVFGVAAVVAAAK